MMLIYNSGAPSISIPTPFSALSNFCWATQVRMAALKPKTWRRTEALSMPRHSAGPPFMLANAVLD